MSMSETTQEKPKKKHKVLRAVLNFVVYMVIVFGIIFGMPAFLSWYLETPYPMAAITSGSMWPELKEGDLVFIHGVHGKQGLNVGDIIVYRNTTNNTLTIHRIVELRPDTVVTKGDANFSADTPAPYSDIIGRTYNVFNKPLRIPYMGSVTMFANNLRLQQSMLKK